MKRRMQENLIIVLSGFFGTCLILFFNPRLDWRTVLLLLLLALILRGLQYLAYRKDRAEVEIEIAGLVTLLHSIEENQEQLPIQDSLFGTLRDEIYKSLIGQRQVRDSAVYAKEQLKRNLEDITHQIKTPLTGVLLLLELSKTDPEHSLEYQSRIQHEIERIYNLSDLLLKLSTLDAGAVTLQREPFMVVGLVLDVELSLEQLLQQKSVYLEVLGDDFVLAGDRVWLMEALLNVVKNAVEVSPTGDKITILLSENAIFQSITVRDRGPGLLKEQQKQVFERFYKSNPQSPGFGIGLSLAKSIVEQHGGELLLRSSKAGSDFEMRFYQQVKLERLA